MEIFSRSFCPEVFQLRSITKEKPIVGMGEGEGGGEMGEGKGGGGVRRKIVIYCQKENFQ